MPDGVKLLFWTGGWDSTFRLLQLLIDERAVVQPIYIDNRRRSRLVERRTMQRLARLIQSKFDVGDRLKPTRVIAWTSISGEGRARNREILRRYRLGAQYNQLARCRAMLEDEVEICIEKPHRPLRPRHVQAGFVLEPLVGEDLRLRAELPEEHRELLHIFGGMRFPLLRTTKHEMLELARAGKYSELLFQTWTCLTPARTRRGALIACGRCRVCRLRIRKSRLIMSRGVVKYVRPGRKKRRRKKKSN